MGCEDVGQPGIFEPSFEHVAHGVGLQGPGSERLLFSQGDLRQVIWRVIWPLIVLLTTTVFGLLYRVIITAPWLGEVLSGGLVWVGGCEKGADYET